MLVGMACENKLLCIANTVRFTREPSVEGMPLDNIFPARSKNIRLLRLPIEDGRVPAKLFEYIINAVICIINPISLGIALDNRFISTLNNSILINFPMEIGSGPVSLLNGK